VIACGVLALDLKDIAARQKIEISMEFLPGGLHNTPKDLRKRLQEAIDDASAKDKGQLICVGYGVCGLGAVGIHARNIPLAIPRVNDCIALFLGSDAAYRQQFAQYPGTYYISAGWVEEKTPPPNSKSPQACKEADAEYQRLLAQHGKENAEAIRYFLASWQRNYQRAAYIDTGVDVKRGKYAEIAQAMAKDYGWKYEQLPGTHTLLESMLLARETTDEILIVPPHYVTTFDATTRKLAAVPVWNNSQVSAAQSTIVLDDGPTGDQRPAAHVGLGIDAGGTYTDVALYDFDQDTILQKAKAPTTKWDYCVGIEEALGQLDPKLLARVDLVSVSTTLATNAIVEGRGQKVGLIILPPYGMYWPEDFDHQPTAPIKGKLEIDGRELEPIDPAQIAALAREMVAVHNVKAFAVSGYASHANPAHELAAKEVIRAVTGMGVTCGHEVSQGLSYKVRADTAMLNARIIPYLQSLLEHLQVSLARRKMAAPIMVVRSDGSLMSVETAISRPIETILSGPAASVAGARYLAKCPNAVVVDIGGTTTDTAIISAGQVRMCADGASVGGWRTHVRALDMRTLGLGGDSIIAYYRRKLTIGPRRVGPVSWLASRHDTASALDWLDRHVDQFSDDTGGMSLLCLNADHDDVDLDDAQRAIVRELAGGPLSMHELAKRLDYVTWQFLSTAALEDTHIVQRCGLTPTDLLHVDGRLSLWNGWAANRLAEIFGRLLGMDRQTLAERAMELFVRLLTAELLKTQLAQDIADPDELDRSPVASALLENLLDGGSEGYHAQVRLKSPIVGIGAPVGFFLPQAAKLLHTEAIIPPHADVANAVGAITSSVVIRRQVEIVPNDQGRYTLQGLPDAPAFVELEEAQSHAVKQLRIAVLASAAANGTSQRRVEVTVRDRVASVTDGGEIFIGRVLEAKLTGRPDLALNEAREE